jgi:hypothetical protein
VRPEQVTFSHESGPKPLIKSKIHQSLLTPAGVQGKPISQTVDLIKEKPSTVLRRAKNIFTHHHLLTKLHHIIATNIC